MVKGPIVFRTLEGAATARTGEAPAHNQLFGIIGLCRVAGHRPTIDFLHLIQPAGPPVLGSAKNITMFLQVKKAGFWPPSI
jgi:hypothetical protein